MEGVESKSRPVWEESQISPQISICLAENVEGFQQCVKEILKLIEEGGNFSEITPEIYDHKKSKLTSQVTELSRMHGVLADQHVHLIGEVSKNSASLIKTQHFDPSASSSPQVTQMFTPDQMSNTHKFRTPIGFDVLLSSGGGVSHVSRREGSESSFSMSSDSDSESFISTNKLLISPVNDDTLKVKETKVPEVLLKKIATLEEELVSLNTKLQSLSDENMKLKQGDLITLNSHLETEKAKVIELQKQVVDLKIGISDSNLKIKTMEDELEASREKLSAAEDEISKLKHELDSEKDMVLGLQEEVSLFVADISVRDDQITELNTQINQSISEISLLKSTHEVKEDTWNAVVGRLKLELSEKSQSVNDLNKKLDALMLERDGVQAQLDTLRAEKRCQDNLIQELETRLNSLQIEHVRVLSSFDNAQKVTDDLKLKVVGLEREVEKQKEVMSDRAEEKREAIRQLSFSLEHYMSGYKELRQAFIGNKRHHAVLTS